jgi:predicted nucleic acid-binding protein
MLALLDNTVLSNFAIVRRTDLLQQAFDEAATASQVLDEYRAGVLIGRVPPIDWSWLPALALNDDEQPLFDRLMLGLNAGEAACLAIAATRNGRLVTDDRDAREFAAKMRVSVSGTIGVLARLVAIATLAVPQADQLLAEMIAAGYRSPIISLTQIHN